MTRRSCFEPRSWVRPTGSSRLLTRSSGRVRAVGRGVRRTTSKFGSRLEPFMHVDVQIAAGHSLDVIAQVETLSPFAKPIGSDYAPLHRGDRDARDGRATGRRGGRARGAALPAAARWSARAGRGRARAHRWCSTRSCCGRWRSRATRRRSTSAPGVAPRDRTATSAPAPAGCCATTAGCPAARDRRSRWSGCSARLLAGDWVTVESVEPRFRKPASGIVAAYLQWHLERNLRSLPYVEREPFASSRPLRTRRSGDRDDDRARSRTCPVSRRRTCRVTRCPATSP